MEPIFSNACKYTMDVLVESTATSQPKWYKYYCYIFAGIFIILAVFGFTNGSILKGLLFAAFSAVLIFFFKTRQTSNAQAIYKKNMEKYGQETETRIFFYEDSIVGKNLQSDKAVTTTYDQLGLITETEHLYILKMTINVVILVDKNGFISDNGADFIPFLLSKCPDVKFVAKK